MGSQWWDIDVCNMASEVYLCGCIPTHFHVLKVFFNCGKIFVVVHLLSHVRLFETPWTTARQAFLSFAISWSLLKLMSIESMMPSNHLTLCHCLLLLPSVFPRIRVKYVYNTKFIMVTSFILESFRSCLFLIYSYCVFCVWGKCFYYFLNWLLLV